MLRCAQHLMCRTKRVSRPQMLRCAQHDRLEQTGHQTACGFASSSFIRLVGTVKSSYHLPPKGRGMGMI